MTKEELSNLRLNKKRESKIKETRNFIIKSKYSGLLNNQKWYRVFEWIELNNQEFEFKTLLSPDLKKTEYILELEKTSLLMNSSNHFISFLELEKLILKNSEELKSELKNIGVGFIEKTNTIVIFGYH